jgi:hypothetical protein
MAKKGKQKLDRTDARAPAGPRQEGGIAGESERR